MNELTLALFNRLGDADRYCVMHIDLDHFKQVNDTLGHMAGDHVLASIAAVLVRVTGRFWTSFRIGGDEFAVLFEIAPPEQTITDLCEALVDQCAAPRQFGGEDCTVSVSIGYAFGEGPPRNPPKVFVNADAALYAVKHAGRSGYKAYAPDLGPVSAIASQSRYEILAAIDACVLEVVTRQQTIWAYKVVSYPIVSVNISAARLRAPDLMRQHAQGSGGTSQDVARVVGDRVP